MIRNYLNALGLAIQYYSRIPLPFSFPYQEESVKRTIFFLPFIGLLLGGLVYLFYNFFHPYFPDSLFAVFLVVFLLWLTGALHADGWMDVFDGIGSCQSKEKMLTIMKDSRVGAMGVIGFIGLYSIKIFSLSILLSSDLIKEALIITPLIARWGVLLAIVLFPYARDEGLGKQYKDWFKWPMLFVSIIWLLPGFWLSSYFSFMLLINLIFIILSGVYFKKKIEGLTGDVYGWMIEGGEMLLWIMLVVYV